MRVHSVSAWAFWFLSVYATHSARTACMSRGLQVAFLERGVYCGRDGRSGAPRRGPVRSVLPLWVE